MLTPHLTIEQKIDLYNQYRNKSKVNILISGYKFPACWNFEYENGEFSFNTKARNCFSIAYKADIIDLMPAAAACYTKITFKSFTNFKILE